MSRSTTGAPDDAPPAPLSRRQVCTVLSGLMIGMLLAMLDNMVVGTAMPTIVGELGGLAHLSWVVTAYTLATAAATPIWGKLGDIYGRKGMFMASIALFLLGSALAGTAQSMGQLIAFRGVQGLGAGGLMVGAMAIIGDLVPPRERGRYQGLMAAVAPLAMIGGPLLGGFVTDHLNWRWAFYVNLPLGGAALVVTALTMHLPKRPRGASRIDYVGAALLTASIVCLSLMTSWGGTEYAWGSGVIIGLGAATAVTLALFVLWEMRAADPILPLRLFRNRNFSLASVLGFLVGFAMFGAVTFLPQYQQLVQGASATNSGLLLLPLMLGMLVTALVVGQLVTRTGRYRVYPIAGGLVMAVGMLLLSGLTVDSTRLTAALFMVVLGVGMGFLMQNTMLIAQNSVPMSDMGAASGAATLFRTIGGSLGVSILGAVYSHRLTGSLTDRLGERAGEALSNGGGQLTPALLKHLPANVRDTVEHAVTAGVHNVFLWAAGFAALAFVTAWFIRETPLRGAAPSDRRTGEDRPVAEPAAL
ncbi:UNVERIFIED_ORG: EmrB/QacA subfamily drug resistance transporter [Actinomadura viridilutea]|uniref:MDR family MFS transporter n=1 Tax=Actinomadura rubrobrunea TaxID=115335 RepID=UPI000A039FF8|nr:MDR family MFS transporter [Actinomadura rubrobrunea]